MFVAGIDAHATYSVIAIVSNTGQLVAGPIRIKNTRPGRGSSMDRTTTGVSSADPPRNGKSTSRDYLIAITMLSGPTKCSTRLSRNPASAIQPWQSAPV